MEVAYLLVRAKAACMQISCDIALVGSTEGRLLTSFVVGRITPFCFADKRFNCNEVYFGRGWFCY